MACAVTRFALRDLSITALERGVLTMAAGLSVLSLTVLLTGLAGWIGPWALAGPLVLSLPLNFLPQSTIAVTAAGGGLVEHSAGLAFTKTPPSDQLRSPLDSPCSLNGCRTILDLSAVGIHDAADRF
jgi:hypothetical protein